MEKARVLRITKSGLVIGVKFDKSCSNCETAMRNMEKAIKKRYKSPSPKVLLMYLTPDYNDCGVLTHFHFSFIDEDEVKYHGF